MYKSKKIMTMAICFAMAISVAGCKKQTDPVDTLKANQPAISAKVVMYNPGGFYKDDTDNDKVNTAIRQKFKNDTNIDLEIQAIDSDWSGYPEKLKLSMAAGDQIDSLAIWASEAKLMIGNDMITPLDSILEKYGKAIKKITPPDAWKFLEVNGKIYGLPRIAPTKKTVYFIRKDWIDKYNLQMPTTIEELDKVARVFKDKDPAGGGKTIPLMLDLDTQGNGMFSAGIVAYHDNLFNDGKLHNVMTEATDAFKKALDYSKNWYADKLTSPDYFLLKSADKTLKVEQGLVGIFPGNAATYLTTLPKIRTTVPEAKLEPLELKDPKGNLITSEGPVSTDFIMIPANSKNAEIMMKYYDWMVSSKDNFNLVNFGIENVNWKKDGDKIVLLGEDDGKGNKKDYNGFYTGMMDFYSLPGWGRGDNALYVKKSYSDPVQQKAYETEYLPFLAKIQKQKWRTPIDYGFTVNITGLAQNTSTSRTNESKTMVSNYVAGKIDWSAMQQYIDKMKTDAGTIDELKQQNEQFSAWKQKWDKAK